MAKFNKVYSSFYNGISEQIPELIHETNCLDMVNCIPDIIIGTTKRPPAKYVTHNETLPADSKMIHTYDRGEDEEEYIFIGTGDSINPLKIFDKDGIEKTLDYGDSATAIKAYLTPTSITSLKGLTVQDRTFLLNKEEEVDITALAVPVGGSTEYRIPISTDNVIIESTTGYDRDYSVDGYLKLTFNYGGTPYYLTSDRITDNRNTRPFTLDLTTTVQEMIQTILDTNLPSNEIYNGFYIASSSSITTSISFVLEWLDYASPYAGDLQSYFIEVGDEVIADATGANEAFYWLKRASADINNEFRYAVYLDNNLFETTDDQSDIACTELETLINAHADYIAAAKGSILKIVKTDGTDF